MSTSLFGSVKVVGVNLPTGCSQLVVADRWFLCVRHVLCRCGGSIRVDSGVGVRVEVVPETENEWRCFHKRGI